jgi:hypothetical protein
MSILVTFFVWCVLSVSATVLLLDYLRKKAHGRTRAAFAHAVKASAAPDTGKTPIDIDALRRAVLSRLRVVAQHRGIPVRIVDGKTGFAGRYHVLKREIELHRDQVHYLVLAHELGHHIAIRRRGDDSEYGADVEGYRLILSVLSDDEAIVLRPVLESLEKFSYAVHVEKLSLEEASQQFRNRKN